MRALADFARGHEGTPELSGIIHDLEDSVRGTGFAPHAQREFASHLALVSRDLNAVARHLASPHPDLRRVALRAVRALPVPDEAVLPVLRDAPTELRRTLYRTLFHARRAPLADRLLPEVRRDHGDPEAAALLPACSARAVAAHLPDLAHAVRSWRRLARRHPDTLVGYLRTLDDEPVQRALSALDPVRPAAVAELAPGREPWRLNRYPHATRASEEGGGAEHGYPTRYPPTAYGGRRVRALLRAMRSHPADALRVLRAMEPDVRARYLDRFLEKRERVIPFVLRYLPLMPPATAEREARSALEEIHRIQRWQHRYGDPHLDLDALAFLPYAEVADTLADAASSGDARRRTRGLAALVTAAGRTGDPEVVAEVLLSRAERAGAERDPVRCALLRSAGDLPVPLLVAALPALERLLADTVQSRDAGAETRGALRAIAIRLLRHPATGERARSWALDVYVRLVGRFGVDGLGQAGRPRADPPWWAARGRWVAVTALEPYLDQVLPVGEETELYRRLAPVLDEARARGDHAPAVAVSREVGRRIRNLPGLRARLRSAALGVETRGTARTREVAETAARMYLAGAPRAVPAAPLIPATRAEHARELVAAEPGAVRLPKVWPLLVREQPTDVVLAVLAAADRDWIPEVDRRAARRWPVRLTSALADRLADLAADPAAGADVRERALLRLGDLPRTAHRLRTFLDGDDIVLREAALSALGRSRDRTLGTVLRGADGPQSRAAGPALSRQALVTPPTELGPLLADTLLGPAKVTVRKTAARLLAHHRPPGAVGTLARALAIEGLHRDVRAAVVGSLVRCLDDPEALVALAGQVRSFEEVELHLALLAPGPWRCPPGRREAMAGVVGDLPEADTRHWRLGPWGARWLPWNAAGDVGSLFDGLVGSGEVFGRSLVGVRALWERGIGLERAPEAVERLLAGVPRADGSVPVPRPVPEAEDTPHRRLLRVVADFGGAVRTPEDDAVVDRVVGLLGERQEYATEAADLLMGRMRRLLDEGEDRSEALVPLALRYLRSEGAVRYPDRNLVRMLGNGVDDRPEVCERLLAEAEVKAKAEAEADADPVIRVRIGRVVLGLVERAVRDRGWKEPWPGMLARVAELGDPGLRAAAWRVAAD